MDAPNFPAVLFLKDTCYVESQQEFLSSPKTAVSGEGVYSRYSPTVGYYADFSLLDKDGQLWKCEVVEERKLNFIHFLFGLGRAKVRFRFDGPHKLTVADVAKLLGKHDRGRRAYSVLKGEFEHRELNQEIAKRLIKRLRPDFSDSDFT